MRESLAVRARATRRGGETVLRRARPAMGTIVSITVRGVGREFLEAVARELFREIERLEAVLSEWREDSSLSAVNRAAGARPVPVPPELLEVVAIAGEASAATGGAFDATWRPLADLWRFDGERRHPPAARAVEARRALVDYRNVEVDARAGTVFLRRRGMRLGFGGVAKAYIAERAAAIASAAGVQGVLVDAGGDVVARGGNGGRPWRIAIRHPRSPGAALATVELRDRSIATSGDYESFFAVGGRRYHHILDPRTGYPATACQSVTVIAPSGALADALATGLFVLGPERGTSVAASKRGVGALFVAANGAVHVAGCAAAPAASRFRGFPCGRGRPHGIETGPQL